MERMLLIMRCSLRKLILVLLLIGFGCLGISKKSEVKGAIDQRIVAKSVVYPIRLTGFLAPWYSDTNDEWSVFIMEDDPAKVLPGQAIPDRYGLPTRIEGVGPRILVVVSPALGSRISARQDATYIKWYIAPEDFEKLNRNFEVYAFSEWRDGKAVLFQPSRTYEPGVEEPEVILTGKEFWEEFPLGLVLVKWSFDADVRRDAVYVEGFYVRPEPSPKLTDEKLVGMLESDVDEILFAATIDEKVEVKRGTRDIVILLEEIMKRVDDEGDE